MTSLVHAVDSLVRLFAGLRGFIGDIIVGRVERSLDEYIEVSGKSTPLVIEDDNLVREWNKSFSFNGIVGYIDSSSRNIGFNPSRFTVTGLALKAGSLFKLVPDIHGEWATCFLGVKSTIPVLERIEKENLGFIAVKNIVGEYYDVDYKDDNIGDELRLSLENNALKHLTTSDLVDVVVIDGPVYYTPQVLFHDNWKNNKYARAFHKLLEHRVKILRESKVPVVGFVKRVEYSHKLARCNEIKRLLQERLGKEPSPTIPDPLIIEYIVESHVRPPLMQPVIIGPLLLEYTKTPNGLENIFLSKVYWYIARRTPRGYQIARIEVLREHWDKWKNRVLGIIDTLIGSLSLRGVPVGIELVDKASRRLTALVYMLLYQRLSGVISLAYDEYAKVNEIYRELSE